MSISGKKTLGLVCLLAFAVFWLPLGARETSGKPTRSAAPAQSKAKPNKKPEARPRKTVREIDWDDLLELNLKTGRMSPKLKGLVGKMVKLPGFMVPLDDIGMEETLTEFLFVPYAQACIHVPAPPPNQIVHANVRPGRKITYDAWQPFWAYGVLKVENTSSELADASYRMVVYRVELYQEEFGDYEGL